MKKILLILLILSITGCGSSSKKNKEVSPEQIAQQKIEYNERQANDFYKLADAAHKIKNNEVACSYALTSLEYIKKSGSIQGINLATNNKNIFCNTDNSKDSTQSTANEKLLDEQLSFYGFKATEAHKNKNYESACSYYTKALGYAEQLDNTYGIKIITEGINDTCNKAQQHAQQAAANAQAQQAAVNAAAEQQQAASSKQKPMSEAEFGQNMYGIALLLGMQPIRCSRDYGKVQQECASAGDIDRCIKIRCGN